MDSSTPGFPVQHQLLELALPHVHQVGYAIQPSHLLLSPLLLPSIFPIIRVFSSESVLCIRWPKYWSFSISPSSDYSGLISFRMDWLDLLAVQGPLESLLQHHSSKASILRRSAFFMVQLSLPYVTTGKTVAVTRRTFVIKMLSLFFSTLSRFVIALLPNSTLHQNHPEKGRGLPRSQAECLLAQKPRDPRLPAAQTDPERVSSSLRRSGTKTMRTDQGLWPRRTPVLPVLAL